MIEVNPDKIKKAEIVVGIPSYNEADSITKVVKEIDTGLKKYFKQKKTVIINVDNNSPDNTKQVFLNIKTESPKIYLSTPPGARGKGANLRNVFLKVKELGAIGGMLIDADIKNTNPKWVKCLIGPIIKGYDYISPVYCRDKLDGSITNNICFPLVYGLLGYNLRQPIGGEVGFSRDLVNYWLSQTWFKEVKKFGIDIFMSFNSIKGGFKLCRADLGSRLHKPSFLKLDYMFLEVVSTFFRLLTENKNLWQRKINLKQPPLVCKAEDKNNYPHLYTDYGQFEKKAISIFLTYYKSLKKYISSELQLKLEKIFLKEKTLKINSNLWAQIVYEIFYIYQMNSNKKEIIKFLRVLYFEKMASFIEETFDKNQKEAEEIIQRQAQIFFNERSYLLSLMKNSSKDLK